MTTARLSPIMGLLLLLLVGVALALSCSANSPKANLGQAQGSPTPQPPGGTPAPSPSISMSLEPHGITGIIIPESSPGGFEPSQTRNPTEIARDQLQLYLEDVFTVQEGTVIARGTNTTPVSNSQSYYSITSYEIEEVTLPYSVTWDLQVPGEERGSLTVQTLTFDKLWRVTVTGVSPIYMGSGIWKTWVDDRVIGRAREGRDSIVTIVFDRALLPEGGRIGINYGNNPVYLPETIHFNVP